MNTIRNSPRLVCTLVVCLSLTTTIHLQAQLFKTLHSFNGKDGSHPVGQLALSSNILYGTLNSGGMGNNGAVFALSIDGSSPKILHSFSGADGSTPSGGLIVSGDTLYGITPIGGITPGTPNRQGNGTVFKMGTDGSGFTNLHLFTTGSGSWPYFTNSDGTVPSGGLVLSGQKLLGATSYGGSFGAGVLFALNTDGTGFTNLYSFLPEDRSPNSIILSGDELYGTTHSGGTNNNGTVFAIRTDGTGFRRLHAFSGADGGSPVGNLTLSANTLYGVTSRGGDFEFGTVFSVKTNGAGFKVLRNFNHGYQGHTPQAGLAIWGNTLYGTTTTGFGFYGPEGHHGTIFSVGTDGTTYTLLYRFQSSTNATTDGLNGASPWGNLIRSGNRLYGTTYSGGTANYGTVFSLEIPTTLSVVPYDGNLILFWPPHASGFTLQSTTNLSSPVWRNVPSNPAELGAQNLVIEPISGKQRLYRLVQ